MKTAVYTGSFNPFTKGHYDIVSRALRIFDKVVIGIGYNPDKPYPENMDERLQRIESIFKDESCIEVKIFSGLAVDFAKQVNARVIIKGVRNVQDFEYEKTQAEVNSMLSGNEIETMLMVAKPELAWLSSTTVRTLESFGKDISDLVP